MRKIKNYIVSNPRVYAPIVRHKAKEFERLYREINERYYREYAKLNIEHLDDYLDTRLKTKIRDFHIVPKKYGELKVFLIDDNGEYTARQFVPALQIAGSLATVDWKKLAGATPDSSGWSSVREVANHRLLQEIALINQTTGIDVVITACNPGALTLELIASIRKLGIPAVRYNADDKQNFHAHLSGSFGSCPMAGEYFLNWTTARECCPWFLAEGGLPFYQPEGADPELFRPTGDAFEYDVSFLGARYGFRGEFIQRLKESGLSVSCFGPEWGGRVEWQEMSRIYSKSRINLGIGGIRHSSDVTCLKGRDFEVPMSGGLYLTSYNSELCDWYRPGSEILLYRNVDDAIDLVRYYLAHPEKAAAIRHAGLERARAEHSWETKFQTLFRKMQLIT